MRRRPTAYRIPVVYYKRRKLIYYSSKNMWKLLYVLILPDVQTKTKKLDDGKILTENLQ